MSQPATGCDVCATCRTSASCLIYFADHARPMPSAAPGRLRQSFSSQLSNREWNHCCPRRNRPVAWSAENTRFGGTSVDYLGGGLRFEVSWPVQVIPKPG